MSVRSPLEAFLHANVPAYPTIPTFLDAITNNSTAAYAAFHAAAVAGHVGTIHFKHRGNIYQLTRVSTLRNTPGFERYKWGLWETLDAETERNDPNVAFKFMVDGFLPWETIRLDA